MKIIKIGRPPLGRPIKKNSSLSSAACKNFWISEARGLKILFFLQKIAGKMGILNANIREKFLNYALIKSTYWAKKVNVMF